MQTSISSTRQILNKLEGLVIALLTVGGLLLVFVGGDQATLRCSRMEPGKPVNCVVQRTWFWLIPGGEERIRDVRLARADIDKRPPDYWDGEVRWIHRVEIVTAHGYFYVNAGGPNSSGGAATRINAFVQSAAETTLVVSDLGMLNTENVLWFVVLLLIAGGVFGWHASLENTESVSGKANPT